MYRTAARAGQPAFEPGEAADEAVEFDVNTLVSGGEMNEVFEGSYGRTWLGGWPDKGGGPPNCRGDAWLKTTGGRPAHYLAD